MSNAAVSACTVLPGNTRVCVGRLDGESPSSLSVIDHAILHDGTAHNAPVNNKAAIKLHRAVKTAKVDAWCPRVDGKPAGASIEFPSILTQWDAAKREFTYYAAIYGEDTSVFADTSKAVRERTKSAGNPKGIGLGTFFEKERIRHWVENATKEAPFGLVPVARIGEYSPHSAAMISIFTKLGAKLGTEKHGIKEVDGHSIVPKWPVDVEIKGFQSPDGKSLNHIFATEWKSRDGSQQISASFTEGISTFTGNPVVRVQIMSNGNLPDKAMLKDVLDSLLVAGQTEIDKREWGQSNQSRAASPTVNLGGSSKELQMSAFAVAGEETAIRQKPNDAPPSLMRIHSFEDDIVDVLPGSPRLLGSHAMRPVNINFSINGSIPLIVLK